MVSRSAALASVVILQRSILTAIALFWLFVGLFQLERLLDDSEDLDALNSDTHSDRPLRFSQHNDDSSAV